jgi:predicted enzyme related to lactoylglutathione lyase
MIKGAHITVFTPDADALRVFLRDKLAFPSIDAGEGWLIFNLPKTELGVHPTDDQCDPPAEPRGAIYLELSFTCDEIHKTMAQLTKRGVKFTSEVTDEGYGLVAMFLAPGGGEMQLYQPTHAKEASS